MAAPSRPPTFKAYDVKPMCHSCGRKLSASTEPLWFQGHPFRAVWGFGCCALSRRQERKAA